MPPTGVAAWQARAREGAGRRAFGWVLALTLSAATIVGFYLAFFELPDALIGDPASGYERERLKLLNDVRAAGVQALGGIVVALGGWFTVRTLRLTREGQITDRFTAAVAHLGDSRPNVRVAAIHALGRVARDSRLDHPAVFAILGDHLRHWYAWSEDDTFKPLSAPHPDVQAVALVLRRRRRRYDIPSVPLEFSGIDWRLAPLAGVQLRGAAFRSANLEGAYLRRADLRHGAFHKTRFSNCSMEHADLRNATLIGAQLAFAHADGAVFRRAKLRGAVFEKTELRGADMRETTDAALTKAITDDNTKLPS
jgi:hypothetical protein